MSRLTLLGFVLFAAAAFVAYLFVVQNGSRETQLSLDLGFAAFQLAQPVSVPMLAASALGLGWLLGAATFLPGRLAAGRKAKKLERQAALSADVDRNWR